VCRLSGVVAENGSTHGLAGQRWTRFEPGKVYGIKQDPDIFAGNAGDLFEPLQDQLEATRLAGPSS
jgi:ribosomal protein L27